MSSIGRVHTTQSVEIKELLGTQILREINFSEFDRSKTAIDKVSEALNFNFGEFLPFLRAEIDKNQYSELLKLLKFQFLIFEGQK